MGGRRQVDRCLTLSIRERRAEKNENWPCRTIHFGTQEGHDGVCVWSVVYSFVSFSTASSSLRSNGTVSKDHHDLFPEGWRLCKALQGSGLSLFQDWSSSSCRDHSSPSTLSTWARPRQPWVAWDSWKVGEGPTRQIRPTKNRAELLGAQTPFIPPVLAAHPSTKIKTVITRKSSSFTVDQSSRTRKRGQQRQRDSEPQRRPPFPPSGR